ncbi:hypothetical protein GUJ93_ZPchr0008g12695 [Zizania palustris]|uniref:Enhancer of polycomb-like protein n=1 Tax=Zizania palustris TaxID=103762 RepID=A0A8J5VJW5_ZIZPA|nr:hypothetical protein GUJ93_ZPchr0008g12695 [Zizania palustris]
MGGAKASPKALEGWEPRIPEAVEDVEESVMAARPRWRRRSRRDWKSAAGGAVAHALGEDARAEEEEAEDRKEPNQGPENSDTMCFFVQALQHLSIRYAVFQAVYNYWKSKRERWQKPILRRLQPPPPVNDTNPYNVFRPREKAYRLHTRRMQRRENSAQSFDKLRLVRRNLEQAKALMGTLIKREERKRETMECEVHLRRIQMRYKHEAQLIDDGITLSELQQAGSSEDDYADSDNTASEQPYVRSIALHPRFPDNKISGMPPARLKCERELKRRLHQNGWLFKRVPERRDPDEPVMLFTRPVDPDKLKIAGIRPPPDPPIDGGTAAPSFRCQGRIGRGGRIIFDRWNPFLQLPVGQEASQSVKFNHRPPLPEG